MTEDEMVGWHRRLDGLEFEPALGVGNGQGSLVCCSPWGCKELDTTELLNGANRDICKPLHLVPERHTVLYANYTSVKLERKKR